MSLLRLQDISKEFRNKKVLNQVTLQIEARDRVALIGNNGTGKTTLLKIATGDLQADKGMVFTAKGIKVGYLSQQSDELSGTETALAYDRFHKVEQNLRKLEAQMVKLSHEYGSPDYKKVEARYAKELTYFEAMNGYATEHELRKILTGLGLKEKAMDQPLSNLSGGERMRVALAKIILEKPDLLILDEPTNHLDLQGIEWLEEFLRAFTGGVLLVSHDRYFLDRVATRIAELDNGRLLEKKCSYTEFMEQKEIERAFYVKTSQNLKKRIRYEEETLARLKRQRKNKQVDSRSHHLQRLHKELQVNQQEGHKHHLGKVTSPSFTLKAQGHISKDIAFARKVTKSYDQEVLFKDISFSIHGGERVSIIGPNGCGKTTLLSMLMGKDTHYQGHLQLGSWLRTFYLGQEVSFSSDEHSALEEIMTSLELDQDQARQYLAQYQFYGDEVNTLISRLSGGERVRLYLAKIMGYHPHLLILDEPTNHLDLSARQALEAAIKTFKGTVIAVSHDRYYLNYCTDKIIDLSQGTARVYQGTYDDYLLTRTAEKLTDKKDTLTVKALEEQIEYLEKKIAKAKVANISPTDPDYQNDQSLLDQLYELYLAM